MGDPQLPQNCQKCSEPLAFVTTLVPPGRILAVGNDARDKGAPRKRSRAATVRPLRRSGYSVEKEATTIEVVLMHFVGVLNKRTCGMFDQ